MYIVTKINSWDCVIYVEEGNMVGTEICTNADAEKAHFVAKACNFFKAHLDAVDGDISKMPMPEKKP